MQKKATREGSCSGAVTLPTAFQRKQRVNPQLLGRKSGRKRRRGLLCTPSPENAQSGDAGLVEAATFWLYDFLVLPTCLFQAQGPSAEALEGRGPLGA